MAPPLYANLTPEQFTDRDDAVRRIVTDHGGEYDGGEAGAL